MATWPSIAARILTLFVALALAGCGPRATGNAKVHGDVVDAVGLSATSAPLLIADPLPWWPELLEPGSDAPGPAPGTISFVDNSAAISPTSLAPAYPYAAGTTRFTLAIPCAAVTSPAALRIGVVDSSMRLVVRERSTGTMVERAFGVLGSGANEGIPERRRVVVPLPAPTRCDGAALYDVHWNIANHHVQSVGPWSSPEVSSLPIAQAAFASELGTAFFFIGSLAMVALYHFGLFAMRRRERAPLFMAVFSMLLASRIFTQRQVMGALAPNVDSFHVLGPVELITIPILSIVFELLLDAIVAPQVPLRLRRFFQVAQAVLVLAMLPSSIPTLWRVYLPLVQILALGLFAVELFYVIRKLRTSHDVDTMVVASGFVILGLAFVLEVFDQRRMITAPGVAGYAQLFLVFSQAFVIAKQNARARRHAEVLSAELIVKNAELEASSKLRDDFVSNTSHELRTPVHGIVGLAEAMVEDPLLPESLEPRVRSMLASGERLRGLVDALLDFAKRGADEQRFTKSAVDFAALVEERAHELGRKLVTGAVSLRWNLESIPPIDADRNRIERLVDALAGNAVKFTEFGVITLTIRRIDDGAELSIVDTGPGIPPSVRAHLFEPFVQGERSDTRVHGGAGLGLASAKNIVALHGGSIDVEPGAHGGTRVRVVLPFRTPAAPACPRRQGEHEAHTGPTSEVTPSPISFASLPGSPLSGPASGIIEALSDIAPGGRILVVDDEPINREVLKQQLSARGYDVAEAADGTRALEALRNGLAPDLILLDVMMPQLSGYEVLTEVRKTQPESTLPIVLLTAKNREQDIVEGFERGASDYVTKPFSKSELLARVAHHLRLVLTARRLAEELYERRRLEGTVENLRILRDRETRELGRLRSEMARIDRDVKVLRGHLLQGEKLASLGQLVAGVAHEINNPISYIGQAQESLVEFFETVVRRLERGDDAKALATVKGDAVSMLELAGFVGTGAARLRDISSALRNYARMDHELMDGVTLDELVHEALVILAKRLKLHRVDVSIEMPDGIRCHRSHVGQIIVNFLSNAGDELDTCHEAHGSSFDGRILVRAVAETRGRPGVRISVEDSGRGVPPAIAEQIFESFFTTKPAGKGTGLGLAICTEIAHEHEGELHVGRSNELGGASFELWLPLDGPSARALEATNE